MTEHAKLEFCWLFVGVTGLIDVFLPRRCLSCKTTIPAGIFCRSCLSMIRLLGPDAQQHPSVVAVFGYGGLLRDLILEAKFQPDESTSRLLARHLQNTLTKSYLATRLFDRPFDAVTYVPSHWRRRFSRGHEFPALLARSISKRFKLPFRHLLECVRLDTHLSATRSSAQRRGNLKGRFKSRTQKLPSSRILLVDDIVTTGTTLKESATVLKELGHEVHCFAFAQTLLSQNESLSTLRLFTPSLDK